MKNLLKAFLKRNKKDLIQFDKSYYQAMINDKCQWFDNKEQMMSFIEEYEKVNKIYSLSLFRFDMFNLIK